MRTAQGVQSDNDFNVRLDAYNSAFDTVYDAPYGSVEVDPIVDRWAVARAAGIPIRSPYTRAGIVNILAAHDRRMEAYNGGDDCELDAVKCWKERTARDAERNAWWAARTERNERRTATRRRNMELRARGIVPPNTKKIAQQLTRMLKDPDTNDFW